jgi:hypothetical protein
MNRVRFDNAKEPKLLIQALIGYELMTNEEMGFYQTMEIEGELWIIQFAGKTYNSHGPHRRSSGIFNRGTRIWPVADEKYGTQICFQGLLAGRIRNDLEGSLHKVANDIRVPTLESDGFVEGLANTARFPLRMKSLEQDSRKSRCQ